MSRMPHTPPVPPENGREEPGFPFFRVYLLCTPERVPLLPGLPAFDPNRIRVIDPRSLTSDLFVDAVNAVVSGDPKPVPRWALYDCAETTGVVVGCLDHRGLPVSLLAATPTTVEGEWHTFTLRAHDPGLAIRTARLMVDLTRPRAVTAVSPYRGGSIDVFTMLGRVMLVTAYTPAHSEPMSATIRVHPGEERPTGGEVLTVDTRREEALRRLQDEIESGDRYDIAAGPGIDGLLSVEKTDAPSRGDA